MFEYIVFDAAGRIVALVRTENEADRICKDSRSALDYDRCETQIEFARGR